MQNFYSYDFNESNKKAKFNDFAFIFFGGLFFNESKKVLLQKHLENVF